MKGCIKSMYDQIETKYVIAIIVIIAIFLLIFGMFKYTDSKFEFPYA